MPPFINLYQVRKGNQGFTVGTHRMWERGYFHLEKVMYNKTYIKKTIQNNEKSSQSSQYLHKRIYPDGPPGTGPPNHAIRIGINPPRRMRATRTPGTM